MTDSCDVREATRSMKLDIHGGAIVTGAARGIGFAVAEHLAGSGIAVVAVDWSEEITEIGERIAAAAVGDGRRSFGFQADVGDQASVADVCSTAADQLGAIRLLVHSAGVFRLAAIDDLSVDDWRDTLNVHLVGAFLLTQGFGRICSGSGSIVLMSSLNAAAATEGYSAYCSAKAGLEQFTRCAALELAPREIRVNAVAPGLILTEGVKERGRASGRMGEEFEKRIPLPRFGEPEDVVWSTSFLLSEQASWITGTVLPVDGGNRIRGVHNFLDALGLLDG